MPLVTIHPGVGVFERISITQHPVDNGQCAARNVAGSPRMSRRCESHCSTSTSARMLFAPGSQRPQHRSQLAALVGEQIFGAWRVLLVESPLDEAGLLQDLEARRESVGADAREREFEIEEFTLAFEQQVADDQDRPAIADDL